jgi:hypothetical protein
MTPTRPAPINRLPVAKKPRPGARFALRRLCGAKCGNRFQPRLFRNFRISLDQIEILDYECVVPFLLKGRLAIVTDAGRDAMDAGSALTNGAVSRTAKSYGPDTPTLVSSWRKRYPRNDGGKTARFTGESTK